MDTYLTLIAYLQLCHLSATCIHVFIICVTVQLFIALFSLSICSCSYYYICTLFFCTSSFPFTHTLTMVAFWRPWICTSRYWTIVFIVQVFDETIHIARSLSPSLILVFSSFLYSCYFHDSPFIAFSCHFLSIIYLLSCVVLYVLLQWSMIIIVLIYSLFRLI